MPNFDVLPEFSGFDWSGGNIEKILHRHDVAAKEAEEVFANQPILVGDDSRHSMEEARGYALGVSDEGRELFIAFTLRKELIRVISARDMSRKERKIYRTL